MQRNFGVTSACGVCGKASIDSIEVASEPLGEGPIVSAEVIGELPERLRAAQRTFERTGGLHATGLFTAEGELTLVREDVGRHNALDKVIGNRMLAGATPLSGAVALVSGRASFELVQKAAVAGIPVLCAWARPPALRWMPPAGSGSRSSASCATAASTCTPGPRGSLSRSHDAAQESRRSPPWPSTPGSQRSPARAGRHR